MEMTGMTETMEDPRLFMTPVFFTTSIKKGILRIWVDRSSRKGALPSTHYRV
jgi:hypothetical protein